VKKTAQRVGLARALSKLGYCSRSQAAELIQDAQVRLNGKICLNPETPTSLLKDRIEVRDRRIFGAEKVYFMLNKPRGIVTTASDEKNREIVYNLLPKDLPWVAPVGRLDKASEGLLLLTNDSAWADRITSPGTHLEKTYHVQVDTVASTGLLNSMMEGKLCGSEILKVKKSRLLRSGKSNSWIEVVLDEGRNRHIRRLLEELDVSVLRLVRVAIGSLPLGELAKGKFRALTLKEKKSIDREIQSNEKP